MLTGMPDKQALTFRCGIYGSLLPSQHLSVSSTETCIPQLARNPRFFGASSKLKTTSRSEWVSSEQGPNLHIVASVSEPIL